MVTVRDQESGSLLPKWNAFIQADITGDYDRKRDVLYICKVSAEDKPAVSVDVSGEFWLRVDPETSEIVGIEIEDFKAIFLEKHPEVARPWHQAERGIRPRPERKSPVLTLIVEFLKEIFSSQPRQLGFT